MHRIGFQTQQQEADPVQLSIVGTVPDWLSGDLIRTHPSQFETRAGSLNHWFDGFAKLLKFAIYNQSITFSSRFLQSNAYRAANRLGRLGYREFATDPPFNLLDRISFLFDKRLTDNGNVNVMKINGRCAALTETTHRTYFQQDTLATQERIKFEDDITAAISTAHPHIVKGSRSLINMDLAIGPSSRWHLYSLAPASLTRREIATLPIKNPSYVHSFGLSEKYVVLCESPFKVNPIDILFSGKPYAKNYQWHKDLPSRIHVVNLAEGVVQRVFETEPFFTFHHVNAYDQDGAVVVDLIAYADASIVSSLYLENLAAETLQLPESQLIRFVLDMASGKYSRQVVIPNIVELPRINYAARNGRPYRFAYCLTTSSTSQWLSAIIKIDTESGTTTVVKQDGVYFAEPVFVQRPGAEGEDDGVLLSIALDTTNKYSYLSIIDAQTMEIIAKAETPGTIPFGFHGQLFAGDVQA